RLSTNGWPRSVTTIPSATGAISRPRSGAGDLYRPFTCGWLDLGRAARSVSVLADQPPDQPRCAAPNGGRAGDRTQPPAVARTRVVPPAAAPVSGRHLHLRRVAEAG